MFNFYNDPEDQQFEQIFDQNMNVPNNNDQEVDQQFEQIFDQNMNAPNNNDQEVDHLVDAPIASRTRSQIRRQNNWYELEFITKTKQ